MDQTEKHYYENLEELSKKANDAYFVWLRHILTMASGLVAILIALHKESSSSCAEHWAFSVTIGLLALGILCGSIALYTEVQSHRSLGLAVLKQLRGYRAGEKQAPGVVSNLPKVFGVAQYACYVSLSLALVSLVVYAVIIDSPIK